MKSVLEKQLDPYKFRPMLRFFRARSRNSHSTYCYRQSQVTVADMRTNKIENIVNGIIAVAVLGRKSQFAYMRIFTSLLTKITNMALIKKNYKELYQKLSTFSYLNLTTKFSKKNQYGRHIIGFPTVAV